MWFKKNKWKIVIPVLILAALATAFFIGGGETEDAYVGNSYLTEPSEKPNADMGANPLQMLDVLETAKAQSPEASAGVSAPVSSDTPTSAEAHDQTEEQTQLTCTISVSCAVLLSNIDLLSEEKHELVPESGWLLSPTKVTFYEGESVFDVLKRTLKEQSVHMEFVDTPAYNSAYIEGIGNLYEFDAGSLSGWMYRVNGVFPNYGCSRCTLENGDSVEWLYTCDLGKEIGGKNDYAS